MPEKIVPHTHCKVCGKAIPQGKIYCSKVCNERDLAEQRKTKRTMMLYFGIFFALLIAMMLMSYFYSGTT
jgi:predicted nucleic acid-binding Zn ribbon protein